MIKKIQIAIFILAFTSSFILKNVYLLIPLALISIVLGFRQYHSDKRELKAADKYCRIEARIADQNNFFKSKWFSVILIMVLAIGIFLISKYTTLLELDTEVQLLFLIVIISARVGNTYYKFAGSIRSFEKGIKLPGRDEKIIPWRKINTIQLQRLVVSITHETGFDSWLLESTDEADMKLMIADWERQSKNHFES
jgi:hypothetical protein